MNNSSDVIDNGIDHHSGNHIFILCCIIGVSVIFSLMDIVPVIIILWSRRLRKPANFAIVSFLLGATIQAMVTSPLYMYKRLESDEFYKPYWVCDAFRLPYFLTSHIMKISLLIVSFDRLCAIRFPFRYDVLFTKQKMIMVLTLSWITILFVDILPFFTGAKDEENCTYLPPQIWGVSVIILFNIIPFVLMAVNYCWLWRIASRISMKDRKVNRKFLSANEASAIQIKDESVEESHNLIAKPKLMQQFSYIQAVRKDCQFKNTANDDETKRRDNEASFSSRCLRVRKSLRFLFEMKATKTSFLLLTVYLLCWGPLGIFYMIDHFCSHCLSYSNPDNLSNARLAVKVLCFLSSPLAPLVYCWRTKEFRMEAIKFFCHKTYKKRRSEEFSKTSWNMSQYSLSMSGRRKFNSTLSLRSTIKL